MSEYFKYEKDYGLFAIVGGVEVPVFSASLSAEIGGYTFSIGLPPTMRNTPIKRGTYGALCYTGGVIADGILINEGPLANKGTYSRQLVFRDVPSYMYYMFVNLSMFVKSVADINPASKSLINLFNSMALNKIDLISGASMSGFGRVLGQINQFQQEMRSEVGKQTDEEIVEKAKTTFVNKIAGLAFGMTASTLAKKLGLSDVILGGSSLPMFILSGFLEAMAAPTMAHGPAVSGGGQLGYRNSIGLSKHVSSHGVVNATIAEQYDFAAAQILFMNFRDLFMQSNRMESLGVLFDQWLSAIGYQKIIIPGKVVDQVILAPEFPYLMHLGINDIGSVYSSTTISMGGDVPLTLVVNASNPFTFPNMVADGLFGASCGKEKDNSGVYEYFASPFGDMTKVGRFKSGTVNVAEKGATLSGENDSSNKGMTDWLNGISDHELYCESISQNIVQVSTEKLHLGLVPGFYGKVYLGTNWYGRVKSYDIQFTLDGYSQTIIFDNMITDTMADPVIKGADKDFSVAFWEKGKVRNIGLYTKESVYASVRSVVDSILKKRRDPVSFVRGSQEKEVAAMVASMPVFRKSKFSGDMKNYTKKLSSEGEGT